VIGINTPLWGALRLKDKALVSAGETIAVMEAREDRSLAAGVVRIPAGHPAMAALGPMFGPVRIEAV
jgi:NADH-quinone oxidoreductase subunit G